NQEPEIRSQKPEIRICQKRCIFATVLLQETNAIFWFPVSGFWLLVRRARALCVVGAGAIGHGHRALFRAAARACRVVNGARSGIARLAGHYRAAVAVA